MFTKLKNAKAKKKCKWERTLKVTLTGPLFKDNTWYIAESPSV